MCCPSSRLRPESTIFKPHGWRPVAFGIAVPWVPARIRVVFRNPLGICPRVGTDGVYVASIVAPPVQVCTLLPTFWIGKQSDVEHPRKQAIPLFFVRCIHMGEQSKTANQRRFLQTASPVQVNFQPGKPLGFLTPVSSSL